ncbi:MAG: peptide-methionine (R)-S-oxide reductase MsrB [Gammaproteobacteria bacterium]|nr:peptide-methionine (R)-S-oxide reductase MsrB [Gammaproteobacteria bacterium]
MVNKDKKIDKTDGEWRNTLSSEQYRVCREHGTEPAFSGEYHDSKLDGVYHCGCCDAELFDSASKYNSGTGWPSFWDVVDSGNVETTIDTRHGMSRTEVHCAHCGAHLGHVFPDGPEPTGLRYCINSVSLKLTRR